MAVAEGFDPLASTDDAWAAQQERRRQKLNGHDVGPPDDRSLWVDDEAWSEAELPCRDWVAPGYALRGAVTVIAGPPSAMKSSLMLGWACALALGREHGRFRPAAKASTIIYNVEDDRQEQRRRLSAALRQFNSQPSDIADRVVRTGPTKIGRLFEAGDNGGLQPTAAMRRLRDLVGQRRPAMLIVDPLAELHVADENDNTALRAVIAEFRTLAVEFNLAVILIHHTRKGAAAPGDPDSARGASAIVGAARTVLTLTGMAEDDARAFGLPGDRKVRSRYIRLDDAKQNYAGVEDPVWYEKVVHMLDNGEAVAAAVPWAPPDIWADIPVAVANAILDEIEAGMPDGRRYSDAGAAKDRAAWRVVLRHVPSLTEGQARQVISRWRKTDVLRVVASGDRVARKIRKGLAVNTARRPGTTQ